MTPTSQCQGPNMLLLEKEPAMTDNDPPRLEARVTRLETHMEHMASTVSLTVVARALHWI